MIIVWNAETVCWDVECEACGDLVEPTYFTLADAAADVADLLSHECEDPDALYRSTPRAI